MYDALSIHTALLIFSFVHVIQTQGPVCYTCSRLPHPWDCDTVMQCNSHEKCYVEQSVTVSGKIIYTSGCGSQTKCSTARRQIESSSNYVEDVTSNIYDVTDLEDDVVTCTKCCNDSNYCNQELCDFSIHTPHPSQQYCLYCTNVLSPEDCEHVVLCNIDEVCFTEFVILNGEQRYRLGCSPRKSCDETSIRQSFPQLIGRKRDLQVDTSSYCGSCCEGMNCNRELCRQGNNHTLNGDFVYELVTSPPRNDLCNDISTLDCLNDIQLNNSVCNEPGYYNYACRMSCGTCAPTTPLPQVDPADCFYESTRYMGQRSTTLSGKTCIAWSDVGQSNAMLDSAGNHCRDPLGRGYPWCYTSTDMDWEYCKVPYCKECHYADHTKKYKGYVSKDMNGVPCLPWTGYVNQGQSTGITDSMFPDGSVQAAQNFCRDIFGFGTILCYTGNHTLSQCDVPVCNHGCRDSPDTYTNCALVQQFICKNEYLSLTLCPKTCNKCSFGLLPQVTVVPQETCVDVPEASCAVIESFVCSDNDAAVRLCPRTCRRCNDIFSTTVPALSTSLMTSSPPPSVSTPQTSAPSSVNPTMQTTISPQVTTTINNTSTTTTATASWLSWGPWTCKQQQDSCYHVRFRTCSSNRTDDCRAGQGKPFEIVPCTNNKCDAVAVTCQDFNNDIGTNGCQAINLEFICMVKSVAWHTCRKSCDLCDTCWDYLDCTSTGTQDFFCRNETLATQYCRQSCGKCSNGPVDVPLSKCGDPVADDSKCSELQRSVCICSDNDINSLCSNFCANSCINYPLTEELRNCTPPGRRRRDLILSQIISV